MLWHTKKTDFGNWQKILSSWMLMIKKLFFYYATSFFQPALWSQLLLQCNALLVKHQYELSDFVIFERWLKSYVSNWTACDDFCAKPLAALLNKFPALIAKTDAWVGSDNPWVRRASVVVLIYSARDKKYLPLIFQRCSQLINDENTYVQKGYGWLLKKTSAFALEEVFNLIMSIKNNMPRLALRYAIEKMPAEYKRQAMA